MSSPLITISPDETVWEASELMREKEFTNSQLRKMRILLEL